MALKDSLAIVISVSSLAISLLSAYLNLMERQNVVASLDYDITGNAENNESVSHRVQTIFTNIGNRPITITRYRIVLYEYQKARPNCHSMKSQDVDLNSRVERNAISKVEPFVLKPGEAKFVNAYFDMSDIEKETYSPGAIACLDVRYVNSGERGDVKFNIANFTNPTDAPHGTSIATSEPRPVVKGIAFPL